MEFVSGVELPEAYGDNASRTSIQRNANIAFFDTGAQLLVYEPNEGSVVIFNEIARLIWLESESTKLLDQIVARIFSASTNASQVQIRYDVEAFILSYKTLFTVSTSSCAPSPTSRVNNPAVPQSSEPPHPDQIPYQKPSARLVTGEELAQRFPEIFSPTEFVFSDRWGGCITQSVNHTTEN